MLRVTLFVIVGLAFIGTFTFSIFFIASAALIDKPSIEKLYKPNFGSETDALAEYRTSKAMSSSIFNQYDLKLYGTIDDNNKIQNNNYVSGVSSIGSRAPLLGDSILTAPYKVKVTFNSVTVHNTHDPGFISPQGAGEYDLSVYVQGRKVDLTSASINCLYAGVDFPPCGLGHSDLRETIYFNKPDQDLRAEITVDVPRKSPLSIFTVGQESDECGRVPFPDYLGELDSVMRNPNLDRATQNHAVIDMQKRLNSYDCDSILENDNEVLGTINKFYEPSGKSYEPIGYGAGDHTNVVSSSRDFTLRYTISVTAPADPGLEKEGLYIQNVRPPNKANGVNPSSPVVLVFNEPVQKDSIKQNFQILFTNPKRVFIGGTTALSTDGKTFTFSPSPPLLSCTSYTVKVGANLMSLTGKFLGSEYSSTFITKSSSNTNICTNLPFTNSR